MKDTAPFPFEGLEILFKAQTATSVLREIVFKLAMMGRLAKQDPREGTGEDAIAACRSHRQRLVARCKLRNPAALPNVSPDERLFVVPNTWAWTRFGEIGDWGSGATPSRHNSAYYGGKTPWLKSGELNDGYVDQAEEHVTDLALRDCSLRLNSPGDVLIAMYGATIGKVALLRTVATTNQAVCACTCFEGMDNEFLLRLLRAYKSIFVDQGAGGAQPNISKVKIVETPCPVPPLAEQKRIVAKVDQLMALCDDLEAKQTKKRDLATQSTRSALPALTTAESPQEFTTAWTRVLETWPVILDLPEKVGEVRKAVLDLAIRGSYSSKHSGGPDSRGVPLNADDSASCSDRYGSSDELQNIPKDWPRRSFREIVAFSQVGIDRGRAEQGAGRRFSYVKMNNITADGQYNDSDLTRIDASDEEVSRYSLRHGDFLFNTRNSAELVGKACVFAPMSKEPHLFNNNILQVRFVDEVDPQFVVYWLGSSPGRALLERRKSATTNVAAIYQGQLMTVPVPIPTLSEQKRIVAKVGQLMSILDDLEAKLRKQEETATRLAESLAAAVAA